MSTGGTESPGNEKSILRRDGTMCPLHKCTPTRLQNCKIDDAGAPTVPLLFGTQRLSSKRKNIQSLYSTVHAAPAVWWRQ
jgi:hypothetical protein